MNWHRVHASASIAMLRTLLLAVNAVFIISGGILFILGILLRGQFPNLDDITPEMRSFSPYILMTLGLVIFFIGLFAFWCTIRGHIAMLYVYSCIVLLIFITEILLAVTVLMRKQTYENTFKSSVRRIMQQYPRQPMNTYVDRLQTTLTCCGIDTYADWFQTTYGSTFHQVPASCCKLSLNQTCDRINLKEDVVPADINSKGCYTTVLSSIKSNYPIFGGIIIVIALIPLLGAILACGLVGQLGKHRYEPVN